MPRYFIECAYKGTRYSGFQVQENAETIQSEMEKAFFTLHRRPVVLTGSSRTDAGVHALQNYFHFDEAEEVHPQFIYKMNAILPRDIVVRNVFQMPEGAHARFDATGRAYEYQLHSFKDPFVQSTSLYFPYRLDRELMQEGAAFILELENFFAFAKTNSQVSHYQCRIIRSQWIFEGEHMLFQLEANRFLRGMVRLLTASLLKLGRHQLEMEAFKGLFSGTSKCGFSVPAHGLFLKAVRFPENYFPVLACI